MTSTAENGAQAHGKGRPRDAQGVGVERGCGTVTARGRRRDQCLYRDVKSVTSWGRRPPLASRFISTFCSPFPFPFHFLALSPCLSPLPFSSPFHFLSLSAVISPPHPCFVFPSLPSSRGSIFVFLPSFYLLFFRLILFVYFLSSIDFLRFPLLSFICGFSLFLPSFPLSFLLFFFFPLAFLSLFLLPLPFFSFPPLPPSIPLSFSPSTHSLFSLLTFLSLFPPPPPSLSPPSIPPFSVTLSLPSIPSLLPSSPSPSSLPPSSRSSLIPFPPPPPSLSLPSIPPFSVTFPSLPSFPSSPSSLNPSLPSLPSSLPSSTSSSLPPLLLPPFPPPPLPLAPLPFPPFFSPFTSSPPPHPTPSRRENCRCVKARTSRHFLGRGTGSASVS
ncbi:hypothetical protein C7M84_017999 [Penaeus vannamei]|uniref:Uncharacterized protein n=1 Tax=Penaeus vannamei TaxID=6689 RepID=A0A3R7PF19_PENVA|nr:hypothetical protein C7M84_017999 [Penaeus vannamei]